MYAQYAMTEVSQFVSEKKSKYYDKLAMNINNPKTIRSFSSS